MSAGFGRAGALMGLALLTLGSADPIPVAARPLPLEEAIHLAKARSRALASLALRRTIAERRAEGVTGLDNPELRIGDVSTDYVADRFDDLEVGLRWRPPQPGATDVERQQRRLRAAVISVERDRVAQRLEAKVRRTHSRLVFHDELLALRKTQVDVERRRLKLVDGLVELGRRSVVYQTKARSWLAQARAAKTRAAHNRNRAERDLQRLVGIEEPLLAVAAPLPELPASADGLVARAVQGRPEAGLIPKRQRLAQAQLERERQRSLPWPSFIETKYHVDARDPDRVELLLGVDLPVFDRNESNIEAGVLATDRRQTEAAALTERLGEEVREAHALAREAHLDWKLTKAHSAALIERTRAVVEQAKGHGTVPVDEVLELELLALRTGEQVLRKRYALDRAMADLCFAVGIEGPACVGAAAEAAP